MEERHTLSEPRHVGDLEWEVDVFRKNVEQPVETLIINAKTFPPRIRKGKVVWQLPKDPNKLPSFGSDERRRLYDLFKEKKKLRKKEAALSRKSSHMSATTADEANDKNDNHEKSVDNADKKAVKHAMEKSNKTLLKVEKKEDTIPNKETKTLSNCESTGVDNNDTNDILANVSLHDALVESKEMAGTEEEAQSSDATKDSPDFNLPLQTFVANKTNGTSVPVTIAKQFIECYYSKIQDGTNDLIHFYTRSAQKSISVGGAHSVVSGYIEITHQLTSFRGIFSTRGVVAQDTVGGGVHLLITGVYAALDRGPSPFAHTVVLVPVHNSHQSHGDELIMFQIQNDALAFLTVDAPVIQPQVVPPSTNFPSFQAAQTMPPPGFN